MTIHTIEFAKMPFLRALLFLSLVLPLTAQATIIHVDQNADAGGDGSSWSSAFVYLQDALSVAVSGDEIWVAQGSYSPSQPSGSSFNLIAGVELYGGFVGNESLREQRAPEHYESLLNGEGGATIVNATNADSTAILDGFTLAHGSRGLYCGNGGGATVVRCKFISNDAGTNATGSAVDSRGAISLHSCTFIANSGGYGGAVAAVNSPIILENCTFHGNDAERRGGALYVESTSATITSCSFSGNRGQSNTNDGFPIGGGAICIRDGSATISHTLVWDNFDGNSTTNGIILIAGATANYTSSLIEDLDLTAVGTGNYDGTDPLSDPLFTIAITPTFGTFVTTGRNLSLLPGSPYLDAGTASVGTLDADGNPRVADADLDGTAIVDIGAHERPNRVFVDADATGANDGTSWADAYTQLQDALAVTITPLEIWVAQGTYYPDEGGAAVDNDRNATFTLANNQSLLGGFAGTETQPEARDFGAHPSVLSGDLLQDDASTGTADNSYHVVTITSTDTSADLSGFTITGGNANAAFPDSHGGGLTSSAGGSTPIAHCEFIDNNALVGGAIFLDASAPVISDSTFSNNTATTGGALRVENGASASVTRCSFTTNTAASGGAISSDASSPVFTDCFINGNLAQQDGGAFAINAGTPSLIGCELKGNRADQEGGAFFNVSTSPTLLNCTLQGNSAGVSGGAVANDNSSPASTNTIIWNNEANGMTTGPDASVSNANANASAPTYNYSLVEHYDLTGAGTGNLNGTDSANDPSFLIPLNPSSAPALGGDLRLLPLSSAVDAGDNTAIIANQDLGGGVRIIDGDNDSNAIIDLGAYERPTTVYVDSNRFRTSGADDGTSWADAYINLQDALIIANADTEIWIADGTYHPDNGGGQIDRSRSATFTLNRRVALLGGFAGHETSPLQRDPSTPPTILSGDLRGNDDTGSTSDNSYHVVTANTPGEGARLDTLTITSGNANGSDDNGQGGGLILRNYAAPTITNCRFVANTGTSGSAVDIEIFTELPSTLRNRRPVPSFHEVAFENNSGGSAVDILSSSEVSEPIRFSHCTFSENSGRGAVYVQLRALVAFSDCVFTSNSSTLDGGALDFSGGLPDKLSHTVERCQFINNTSGRDGGGLHHNSGALQITDSIFRGNVAAVGGGGLRAGSGLICTNSVIQGNRADGNDIVRGGGGGATLRGGTFINCSFQGNRSTTGNSGAIYASFGTDPNQLINCIIWNNEANGSTATPEASVDDIIGPPDYTHCLVQNIDLTGSGVGNLDGTLPANNPLFFLEVDPALAPLDSGDLRIGPSPAVNAGLNSANSQTTDLAGDPRIQDNTIDLGAHESKPTQQILVTDDQGNPLTNGGPALDLGLLRLEDLTETIDLSVTNTGLPVLTTGSVTPSGPNAGDLSVSTALPASITPYTIEPLQLTLALSAPGSVDASITLTNGDPAENPFNISFTGTIASDLTDGDGDGLSDYQDLLNGTDPTDPDTDNDGVLDGAEVSLAALGFSEGVDDSALLAALQGSALGVGLYTGSNLQSLAIGDPVISRDPLSGKFTIATGLLQSPDLGTTPFAPLINYTPTYDPETGELLLEFVPPNAEAYFYQIFGKTPEQ